MNREGVVQRRNVVPRNAGANGGASESSAQVDSDERRNASDEEVEDTDSKETRLTLMEEVLLLGLKDKEVILI